MSDAPPSNALARSVAHSPWRPLPNESTADYIRFWLWLGCGGEIGDAAERFNWASRRQSIETYEAVHTMSPQELTQHGAVALVQTAAVEALKLRQASFSSPSPVMSPKESLEGLKFGAAAEGIWAQEARAVDYSQCSHEDRECLIRAKEILDRLLGVA